jgi:hypothetical protein
MSSVDDVVAGIDGSEFHLGVVIEAEAITVAERASSLTMSPDHLEGEHPRRSAVRSNSCMLSTAGKRRLHQ